LIPKLLLIVGEGAMKRYLLNGPNKNGDLIGSVK
jgi:hypothetical protein